MAFQANRPELTRSERGAAIVAKHEADIRRDRVAAMAVHTKALLGSGSIKPSVTAAIGRGVSQVAADKVRAPSPIVKPPVVARLKVATSAMASAAPAKPVMNADSLVELARSVGLAGYANRAS